MGGASLAGGGVGILLGSCSSVSTGFSISGSVSISAPFCMEVSSSGLFSFSVNWSLVLGVLFFFSVALVEGSDSGSNRQSALIG
jgi:hypothetical protein